MSARSELLAFYRKHRRDLPWRRTRDPYAIWVSEIMLQQTQVDTVVPRYHKFLAEFPTVQALAAATEIQVCEAWAGLGYYRRARHLHQAARQVVQAHGGALPQDVAALRRLAGIGRYTAGAVASIAFGMAVPLVDGNVERVLSRLHALSAPPTQTLWALAEELVHGPHPGDLNQALMELGATVCTPRAPRCDACPWKARCRGRANPLAYPAPRVRAERAVLRVAFAWLASPEGVWLMRRPLDGLWAGLWELPSAGDKKTLAARYGALAGPLATVRHDLTHRRVLARLYQPRALPPLVQTDGFMPYRDPTTAPLSGLARKMIDVAARCVVGGNL